jgi:hypothetical protein
MLVTIPQIKEKAETWFLVSGTIITVGLPSIEDKFPCMVEFMRDENAILRWQATMQNALMACAVISTCDSFPRDEAELYVAELMKHYNTKYLNDPRLDHAMQFAMEMRTQGISLVAAFGFWVLSELKGEKPTDDNLELVSPLGIVITELGQEWWKR